MSKLLLGNIDVSNIDKKRLYKGKKGIYMSIAVWLDDEADEYGNHASIQQSTKKGEEKIYLGNLKYFDTERAETPPPDEDDLPF